jgi:hypothetical protein
MEPTGWTSVLSHSISTVDWNYAFSTLIIRFVGIFVVLGILQVVMQFTGRIFAYLDTRENRRPAEPPALSEGLTPEETAAVAVALELYDKNQ